MSNGVSTAGPSPELDDAALGRVLNRYADDVQKYGKALDSGFLSTLRTCAARLQSSALKLERALYEADDVATQLAKLQAAQDAIAAERDALALRLSAILEVAEAINGDGNSDAEKLKRLENLARGVEKGEPWKCGECGQEFGEQIDLALHMSAKHRV